MEVFNLDIIPGKVAPVIHASQYDDGREFRANLFEGASVYTLTGAETITINVRKPDGNVVTAAVTNTADSFVEFATTEQMTACAGANLCELKFENSPVKIGSLNFILSVEADPLEGGIQSESAIHDLQAQIAAAVADQYDAADVIFDAAPTPGHGVGFAVTSEGVKQADDAVAALIPENITDLADTDINTPTNGEILVYNNGSWENQANPASTTNFAPDYDDTATYNTNDKVIYQGLLYVCLEDSVTGAWDSTKWQNISVADYTAELLPIESGSATNTKDYIDSGNTWELLGSWSLGNQANPNNGDIDFNDKTLEGKKEIMFALCLNNTTSPARATLVLPISDFETYGGLQDVMISTTRVAYTSAKTTNHKITISGVTITGSTYFAIRVFAR